MTTTVKRSDSSKVTVEASISNFRRRDFLKLTGAGGAGVVVDRFRGEAFARDEAFASSGGKTNIIFILADDLGYADLGCYGQEFIKTPYLDRMAREGLKFTQCYTGAVVCTPSRSGSFISATVWIFVFASYAEDGSWEPQWSQVDSFGPPTRYFTDVERYRFGSVDIRNPAFYPIFQDPVTKEGYLCSINAVKPNENAQQPNCGMDGPRVFITILAKYVETGDPRWGNQSLMVIQFRALFIMESYENQHITCSCGNNRHSLYCCNLSG